MPSCEIRKGTNGPTICTINGNKICQGSNGKILCTINGNQIKRGADGTVIANISNDSISSSANGQVLCSVGKKSVRKGLNGGALFTLNQNSARKGTNGTPLFTIHRGSTSLINLAIVYLIFHDNLLKSSGSPSKKTTSAQSEHFSFWSILFKLFSSIFILLWKIIKGVLTGRLL